MRLIVLECRGRLANLVLCWANARHVMEELGISDSRILLNYDLPPDTVKFPGATVIRLNNYASLPRATRNTLAQAGDCVWVWEDVYSNFPPAERMSEIIRSITIHEKFETEISAVINQPTLGVHVRHGDFEKWDGGARPIFPRAPDEYYLQQIAAQPIQRIFLASDGEDDDLKFITSLPLEVIRGRKDNPIFDLLALSRCTAIIGSNSTFSTVAAYLGNVPLVTP